MGDNFWEKVRKRSRTLFRSSRAHVEWNKFGFFIIAAPHQLMNLRSTDLRLFGVDRVFLLHPIFLGGLQGLGLGLGCFLLRVANSFRFRPSSAESELSSCLSCLSFFLFCASCRTLASVSTVEDSSSGSFCSWASFRLLLFRGLKLMDTTFSEVNWPSDRSLWVTVHLQAWRTLLHTKNFPRNLNVFHCVSHAIYIWKFLKPCSSSSTRNLCSVHTQKFPRNLNLCLLLREPRLINLDLKVSKINLQLEL